MNKVSTIQTSYTAQQQARATEGSCRAEDKEALIAEFSKLLSSIGQDLANQSNDFYLDMDIRVQSPIRKEALKELRKETEQPVKERDEVVRKKEVKTEECEDLETKEVLDESSKKVVKEDSAAVKEEVEVRQKAESEEVQKDNTLEAEKITAPVENAVNQVQQEAQPVAEEIVSQVAAVLAAKDAVKKESSADVQEALPQQVGEAEAAAEVPLEAAAETANDSELAKKTKELFDRLNAETPKDAEVQIKANAEEDQAVDAQLSQQGKTAKAKSDHRQAAADVELMEQALKNAMLKTEASEKAVSNAFETKAALQQVLQPFDTKVKISAASQSPHFLINFMREAAATATGTGQGTQGNPLPGLTGTLKANNSMSAQIKKQEHLSRAVQTKTIERIEEALREVARSKDGKTISVRLDPPSLGSVKIEVTYKEGTLSAKLLAESQQVNQLIRDKAFELQAVLRKLGLPVESVNVSVGQDTVTTGSDQSFSSSSQSTSDQKHGGQGSLADLFAGFQDLPEVAEKTVKEYDHWVA